jgi:hypothetical protein
MLDQPAGRDGEGTPVAYAEHERAHRPRLVELGRGDLHRAPAAPRGWAGGFSVSMAGSTVVAVVLAGAGMAAGQMVRHRLSAELFRRCFFAGLLLLGLHLIVQAVR